VIKTLEHEEMSRGGIVLPDSAKEKPFEGEVVAVGDGRITDDGKRQKMEVKVKDRVVYSKYSGTEIKLDGEEYLILSERDILAIVTK
ncbi:MAG: co-chaperone GroES, partial [Synergistaceae bacterium]|nr:co-chaperone GroES [Synergistaceae bacterium]